jgi:hypothetical protein
MKGSFRRRAACKPSVVRFTVLSNAKTLSMFLTRCTEQVLLLFMTSKILPTTISKSFTLPLT